MTDPHSSPTPESEREREPVPISGQGWDRMVALKESGTRTLGSM